MRRLLKWIGLGVVASGLAGVAIYTAYACCGGPPPPAITDVVCTPDELWPPNHKYVEVRVKVVGVNIAYWYIAWVASDQPDDADGVGDGQTTNDIVVKQITPDPKTGEAIVLVRAERCGVMAKQGVDRNYTIGVVAVGNGVATGTCGVRVPHDQGQGNG